MLSLFRVSVERFEKASCAVDAPELVLLAIV